MQQAGDSFKVNIRARLCQTDFRSKTLGKPAAPQNAAYIRDVEQYSLSMSFELGRDPPRWGGGGSEGGG